MVDRPELSGLVDRMSVSLSDWNVKPAEAAVPPRPDPLEAAKRWLDERYVFHPKYQSQENHSSYAQVNLGVTFMKVRDRIRQERSLSAAVADVKQHLHSVHKAARAA